MTQFHFIHIPKNGGMSIRNAKHLHDIISFSKPHYFKSKNYKKKLLKQMSYYNEHHGFEHARWCDLNQKAQKRKCFAIVRNPWSRVVSRYTFLIRLIKNGAIQDKKQYKELSFEEFLEERHFWGNVNFFWHRAIRGWYPQIDYVTNKKHQIQCDILRFESYDHDTMRYLNLEEPLEARNVSNGHDSKRNNYQNFYTKKTKYIVADWYKKDIDFFGFDFNSSATKNIYFSD